ncbi:type VI secretion system-associated FHA domain protein TagH [Dyella nitratireducens]|uniref:Phosphopeptide-binding protein n=1 Tax=Dyella nitratireducens TaxID=1849580 RepID=A0ABQ1G810_9GAMM|nr:type VI secretion system-associated FHA domain protein TagH [Dyella nitratireducens]GGA38563.1 phosphopeptide-binding protein [Dyella nitratireducens]GLQ40331.1 phosphopeptide-binding protein [Dyella nitratireducens]
MSTPQTLTLVVQGQQAAQFGSRSQKSFHAKDGSIGRSEDCDWVLSASGVSRVHAMVRYLNGIYFIEDRSTNGMLLNGSPLIKGDPAALKNGDRLQIDTFEVAVRMEADSETIVQVGPPVPQPMPAPAPPPVSASFNNDPLDFDFFNPLPSAPAPSRASSIDSLIPGTRQVAEPRADLDPLSFLDEPFGAPAPEPAPAPSWNHTPSVSDHFRPPTTDVRKQANTLPENWDLTTGDFAPAPAAPVAPPEPAPVVASPPAPPPQVPVPAPAPVYVPVPAPTSGGALPQDVEQIFRIVVDGVMDVLRARAEIKNTFRLPVTVIQRSENNPLKFALGTDEAMQKILGPANPGFLSGTAAFQDAFEDIRLHQMAMLAGVRAGFEALLVHFNPDRYEHEVDGGKRGGVAFGAKGKYWDKYRDNFEGLIKNPDDTFRRLFGDEFARAYEEQLARLKSSRRK